MDKIKPIQNSRPAKAIIKKDVDINIKSSFIEPTMTIQQYSTTHIISEYRIIIKIS